MEVYRCRTVQEQPLEKQWNLEVLKNINGLPWEHTGTIRQEKVKPPDEIPPEKLKEPNPDQPPEAVPRSFRIAKNIIGKYGYSRGCSKCTTMKNCDWSTLGHSETCRKKIVELAQEDSEYQGRAHCW